MREPEGQTQQAIAERSAKLWPHPFGRITIDDQLEEDGKSLERLLRVQARRSVGELDAKVGRRRYDEIAPQCLFGKGETALCHEAATLVLAEYTDDTAYRAAELYFKACERQDAGACAQVKQLTASFTARNRRREDGGRMLSKLCLAGSPATTPRATACGASKARAGRGRWPSRAPTPTSGPARWWSPATNIGSSAKPSGTSASGWRCWGGSRSASSPATWGRRWEPTSTTARRGIGLGIWGAGRAKVGDAEELAAEYDREAARAAASGGGASAPMSPLNFMWP
jgi:hypothetical protein